MGNDKILRFSVISQAENNGCIGIAYIYDVKTYYLYILTNKNFTLFYIDLTNDLERRLFEHKTKVKQGLTSKYQCDRLLYFEQFDDETAAMKREKQLKGFKKEGKLNLINKMNPDRKDLSADWFNPETIEFGRRLNLQRR